MPRDGSNIYHRPAGTDGIPNYPIESSKYNTNVADVEQDLNLPRPIVAGGTGATSADGALDNLSAEKFKQVVTNWDSNVWRAGSFYAASTATGNAPVAAHAFAGIAYYANATDLVLEAIDITDPLNPIKYVRVMNAGVWGNWLLASSLGGSTGDYTFNNTITFPPASGQIRFNNATQNSTTELFVSHTTALGIDNTGLILASIKAGNDLFIQDKDEPTKYKIFTATANPVLSGGDFRVKGSIKSAGIDIVSDQRVLLSSNIGIAIAKKNYIINGAMMVSQEWGSTALSAPGQYPVDMFWYQAVGTTGVMAYGQIGGPSPAGSPGRIRFTVTTLDASVAAGDVVFINHSIEGLRWADLMSGTANAKTVTLQFGIRAPQGTYCVSLRNGATNRAYVAEYVITAGEHNIDTIKSIVIPLDKTGTWATDNTAGVHIAWTLMCGTTNQTTAGVWVAGTFAGTANQYNFMGTFGNLLELFDVSLTEGTVAPPFQVPDYVSELLACQRYYSKLANGSGAFTAFGSGLSQSTNSSSYFVKYPLKMRGSPSVSYSGAIAGYNGGTFYPLTGVGGSNVGLDSMLWQPVGNVPAGVPLILLANNDVNAFIAFNARL